MENHDDSLRDLVYLAARAALGASIAAHGTQKLAGWFDGPGLQGAAGFMRSLGFQPGEDYARAASLTEVTAGTLIATGAFGPIGPALLLSVMTTAVGSVHIKNGYWNSNQGFEMNTMYALAALLLGVEGYGRLSFDGLTGLRGKTNTLANLLVLSGGIAGGIYALSRRQPLPQALESDAKD